MHREVKVKRSRFAWALLCFVHRFLVGPSRQVKATVPRFFIVYNLTAGRVKLKFNKMKNLKIKVLVYSILFILPINFKVFSQVKSYDELEILAKKSTDDEIVDYSVDYLKYLKKQIDEKEKQFQKQIKNNGISFKWIKIEKLQKIQKEVLLNYIQPIGQKGNIKAVLFLSGRTKFDYISLNSTIDEFGIDPAKAIEYLNRNTSKEPEILFIKYQFKLLKLGNSAETIKLLDEYFLSFNENDLLRIRKKINQKIEENLLNHNELIGPISDSSFYLNFNKNEVFIKNGLICNIYNNYYRIQTIDFLKLLRKRIDLIFIDKHPESLVQILKDLFPYKKQSTNKNPDSWEKMVSSMSYSKLSDEDVNLIKTCIVKYRDSKNQYFSQNKEFGSKIFRLLSSLIYCDDETSMPDKTYFLKRAAELGDGEAFLNLACLFHTYFSNTKNLKYNDSCIFYLEKAVNMNMPEAFALKGIKVFNGEGYIKNKEEGVKLLLEAKSLNSTTATTLLETYPKKYLEGLKEGYYFNESVKLNYPWNFKVLCSNNCGKYTYPKEIIFGKYYDENGTENMPQIKYSDFFFDQTGNPKINISYNDFRRTFSIAYMGFEYWKHTMCSATCQLAHENKNNKNFDAIRNKRNQIDNEIIKCVACKKSMKRRDMISISDCPCYTETGSSIGINLSQNYDIHGDSEPKACSYECQINFCKIKCNSKGYTSKY